MDTENSGPLGKLFLTFVGIIALVLLALVLLFCWPLFFIRPFVLKLQEIFHPEFYNVLSPLSSAWLNMGSNSSNNVIFSLKFRGKLDFNSARDRITRILLGQDLETGQLFYPEFQMHLVKWFGFWFWKPESEFSMENHVERKIILEGSDPDSLAFSYEKEFLAESFQEGLSPWKLALVESSNCWFLLYKFHHSLSDGFSMFNAFMKCTDDYSENIEVSKPPEEKQQSIPRSLSLVWRIPFGIGKMVVSCLVSTNWVLSKKKAALDRAIVKSTSVSHEQLKEVSTGNNMSTVSVVMTVLTGGIRHVIRKSGVNVPGNMSFFLPVPAPNRPSGLVNHYSAIQLTLPVALEGRNRRLEYCERNVQNAKKSIIPYLFMVLGERIASLPSWLIPIQLYLFGLQITCFAGPKKQISMDGQPVEDMHFNVWWNESSTVLLCVLSYNGKFRIVANADRALFPSEESLEKLLVGVEREANVLSLDTNMRICQEYLGSKYITYEMRMKD